MEEQNLISGGEGAISTTTHQSINIQSTRNAAITSKATTTQSAIVQVPAGTTHRGSNIVESEEAAYLNALTWPPRSYTCSFCRKEFRSAQALGGHMNVHRRDRARLRHQSPSKSTIALNINIAPNHEHDHDHDHHIGVLQKKPREVPVTFPVCPGFDGTTRQREPRKRPVRGCPGAGSIGDAVKVMRRGSLSYESHVWGLKKGGNGVSLELEMGVFNGGSEDLDLELRLGFGDF